MTTSYFAGPLDGQPAPPIRGQHQTWRNEHGKPIATRTGDLELLDRQVPLAERRAYLLDDDTQPATYVWLPSWRTWRRQPTRT